MMNIAASRKKNKDSREGGILLLVLLLVMVFSFLGLGLLTLSREGSQEASQVMNQTKAFWLAEAGYQELKAILSSDQNKGPLHQYGLVDDSANSPVLQNTHDNVGSYKVFVRNVGANNTPIKVYEIESVGQSVGGGAEVTVRAQVRLRTGSESIWSTNNERGINFVTGDVMNGPMRTNGELYIKGNPTFNGFVSSGAGYLNYTDRTRGGYGSTEIDPLVFVGGIELGAAEVDFDQDIILDMKNQAKVMPSGDYSLEIKGSYADIIKNSSGETNKVFFSDIGTSNDDDNILYFPGNVDVKGTLDGRVSIASEGIISIVGDVVYHDLVANHGDLSSGTAYTGDDALGLFSSRKVEIDYPSAVGTPVNIHAAIFVTEPQGSDTYSSFNAGFGAADRSVALGTTYINLYGSIQQHTRGVIGTSGGGWRWDRWRGWVWTSRTTGYYKNYRNDSRFISSPPPGAPYDPPYFYQWSTSK